MAYCFNPYCAHPETPGEGTHCQHCRSALALQDRYYGLRLLGQGGFGRTILGEDRGKPSRPRCVIKVFLPQGQGDLAQAAELFEQEAVRLDELGHHGQIPALLSYATQETAQGRSQCIVQEFVPGRNLGQVVQESGPFSEAEVRSVLLSVLPVLQFVHDHEVIHRDVKPANLIQREDGELVLVDFGAAKYATATALGKTGTVIGSAEYAAPEQVQGQARFASDIYGLGVTCLFLLTGMSPFDLFSTLEDEWVWRDYLPENPVSEEFGAVVDKMIVRAMRKRYGSAQALLGVLAPQPKPDPVVEVQGVAVEPLNLDVEVKVALTEDERVRGCETVVMPLETRFSVKIPAGVRLGQRLRLAGKGKVDPYTGSRGDVFLVVGDRPAPPSPQPNTPR
ncbi:MAG: protein kinase domain-containing protein, partial [Prochlorothrix sp.]